MKLGIIGAPEAKTLVHAKELGLDFVEFDLNPPEFFGRPLDEIVKNQDEIKKAIEETGVEVGAVGRWASHILDENGDVIEAEWSEVKKAIDFGAALGAKHYLCSVAYVPQLSYYKNITAAIKVLNRIVSYAKENGMKCGIVNCMMAATTSARRSSGSLFWTKFLALASSMIRPTASYMAATRAHTSRKAWNGATSSYIAT